MDTPTELFQTLGISVLLGMLVGLERERSDSSSAGLRTFPLITVLGTLSGLLAVEFGGWIVPAGFLGVVTVVVLSNLLSRRAGEVDPGTTTEFAMLLMFAVGAYLSQGERAWIISVAVGGGVAVLLQFKPELHGVAAKLGDEDLKAIMRFVLITFVILPVLPNQRYGLDFLPDELRVFNPREIWLMVVLIVGITLGGYITYKFFGQQAGMFLGGLLGGAISSTATTVAYARRASSDGRGVASAAVVILLASSVVYVRVLIEISVVARGFLKDAAGPVLIMMALTLLPLLAAWWMVRRNKEEMPPQENPTQLKSALVFALLYAGVLFGLAAAQQYWGGQGLYVVAVLSGLTDMDAITLSTARLVGGGRVTPQVGWQLIVIATMANLAFKAAVAAALGGRRLLLYIAALFLPSLAGGGALLALWNRFEWP